MDKLKRKEIYEHMLKLLEDDEYPLKYGYCLILDRDLGRFSSNFDVDLPELYAQKPKVCYTYTYKGNTHQYFWWKPGNRKPRIRALERALKLLENDNN